MKNIEIVSNFFDDFENIKEAFKSIPLYGIDDYKKRTIITAEDKEKLQHSNFPGKRSESLHRTYPFLFNLILREIFNKINKMGFNEIRIDCCLHLRLGEDNPNDFIHTDPSLASMLVYLSDTNLKSGTAFYPPESDKPYLKVPFIQNSAVFFPGRFRHKSILNYGNDIHDGRLTLNGFLYRLN
jgi:hypothetical protein